VTTRTVEDFKAKHDPRTVIARLETELKQAQESLGVQDAIRELLGMHLADVTDVPAWTVKPTKDAYDSPGAPTLFLSDVHAGEVVKRSEVPGGCNEFNMTILAKRLEHTIRSAQYLPRLIKGHEKIPGIIVVLGGDMVSGDIHEELKCTNELPTIPTVLELYEMLVGGLKMLAAEYKQVFVPCVSGNHGRNTMKTWNKARNHTSFDWLLYQMLARAFKADPRVKFYIPDASDALYRVYGTRYLLTHGDQFKAGDSIIGAIGPLMRGNQKKTARNQSVGQSYDVMLCGHWHQYIHLARLIVNGSVKGYDEYAAGWNFPFELAQQALWMTHPRYGINWRMPIFCDTPGLPKPIKWTSQFDEPVNSR
jgi:predicted phosphodiesterase